MNRPWIAAGSALLMAGRAAVVAQKKHHRKGSGYENMILKQVNDAAKHQ